MEECFSFSESEFNRGRELAGDGSFGREFARAMCKIALAKYLDATVDDAQYIVKDGRRFWPLPYENGFVESEFDMQPDDIVVMCELHSQVHLAGWVSAAELEKYKIS